MNKKLICIVVIVMLFTSIFSTNIFAVTEEVEKVIVSPEYNAGGPNYEPKSIQEQYLEQRENLIQRGATCAIISKNR